MIGSNTYSCGMCGGSYEGRDAYTDHLVVEHPETWLARRAIVERTQREKKAAQKASK